MLIGKWDAMSKIYAVTTLLSLDSGKELMWPFSNPPYVLGENDIPIAVFHGKLKGKELYREYLAAKYGKHKMQCCPRIPAECRNPETE